MPTKQEKKKKTEKCFKVPVSSVWNVIKNWQLTQTVEVWKTRKYKQELLVELLKSKSEQQLQQGTHPYLGYT